MKKTLLAVFFSLFISSIASAEIGVNVGVTAQIGSMEAKGEESSSAGTTETSDTEEALFGTAGLFIEKDLSFLPGIGDGIGSRITIGYDNIAHDISLGTQTNVRNTTTLGAAGALTPAGENAVQATVTDFQTIYARVNILDWLYVKAGEVTVDFDAEFTKNGVVSTAYGSKSHELDGTIVGVGVEQSMDNGLFFRVEYNSYDIDGKSVTNSTTDSKFTAKLKDVSGETARISVGKAF